MPTTVVTGSETDPDTSQYQRMDWETRRLGYKTGAATPLAAAAGALGAIITRPMAGPLFVLSSAWLHAFTIDDPVGAVPVHLVNGIWGTLAVSLFADGGFQLLKLTVLKRTIGLWVSAQEELAGLDVGEHGGVAYPYLQPLSIAAPTTLVGMIATSAE